MKNGVPEQVEIMIKGQKKLCQKTVKEQVECTKDKIRSSLKSFKIRTKNILHQYKCVDDIKKLLSFDEILFHIDFSKNYNCKYTNEIQSAHFGRSKLQVTLHSVVMYYKVHNEDGYGTVLPVSLCTVSDSMRYVPAAICAHLEAVQLIPSIITALFYLMALPHSTKIQICFISWQIF